MSETTGNKTKKKPKPFAWTKQKRQAATLVAEDLLTDRDIAKKVKIGTTTLEAWKLRPEFMEYVRKVDGRLASAAERFVIGRKTWRVGELDALYAGYKEVVKARGKDPDHRKAPGGKTGLLVRTIKQFGSGEQAQRIEEFSTDVATTKEMRETLKQAAQELNQWDEKTTTEHVGKGGSPISFIEVVTVDRNDTKPPGGADAKVE